MVLINGVADNRVNVTDRGLQYGDGLFETMAYRNGKIEFLDAHLKRLILGCERLAINFQQINQLSDELNNVVSELKETNAVIKIIISRGSGGRGYAADNTAEPTRIISTHPMPSYPDKPNETGITAKFCQQKLSENSSLAGIKHLNRLEQVLARTEWGDATIAEGIMSDQHSNVIEGTMSNLFIIKSGKLITAQLNKCGVEGIIRAEILRIATVSGIAVEQTNINQDMLLNADEVFVCNSIIGIWPIINLAGTHYSIGETTRKLQFMLSKLISS